MAGSQTTVRLPSDFRGTRRVADDARSFRHPSLIRFISNSFVPLSNYRVPKPRLTTFAQVPSVAGEGALVMLRQRQLLSLRQDD